MGASMNRLFKKLGVLGALTLALLASSGAEARDTLVVDMRWETQESRTFRPHLALVQHLIVAGFTGDVIALVDEDFATAGWATGLDLGTFTSENAVGGKLLWKKISELEQEPPRPTKLYLRMESTPQEIRADIAQIPGLELTEAGTVFMKLSLLEDSDREALENVLGAPATDKDFDGFFIFNRTTIELQSPARRMGTAELVKKEGSAGFSDYLATHETAKLAQEILATVQWAFSRPANAPSLYWDFMTLSKTSSVLRSRLRMMPRLPCSTLLRKA